MTQPQHPLFIKYTRDWLHEQTGYSKGYLSRVATGNILLSLSFIERVAHKLEQPEEELFLADALEQVKAAEASQPEPESL